MIIEEHSCQSLSLADSKSRLFEVLTESGFKDDFKNFYKAKYYYGPGEMFRYVRSKEAYSLLYHIAFIIAKENNSFRPLKQSLKKNVWDDVLKEFGVSLKEYENYFEEYLLTDYPLNWTGYYKNYSGTWIPGMHYFGSDIWAFADCMYPVINMIGGKYHKSPLIVIKLILIFGLSLSLFSYIVLARMNVFMAKSYYIIAPLCYLITTIIFLIYANNGGSIPNWRKKGICYALVPISLSISAVVSYLFNYFVSPFKLEPNNLYQVMGVSFFTLIIGLVLLFYREEASALLAKHEFDEKKSFIKSYYHS